MRDVKSFILFACSASACGAPGPAANVPLRGGGTEEILSLGIFGNKFMRHSAGASFS
jgi:hypothetical protein